MGFILAVLMVFFFCWCMKKLTGWVPGGGLLKGFSRTVWGRIADSKKITGAKFQSEGEQRKNFKSTNKGLVIDGKGRRRLGLKESFEHVAVVSPTGGGKTSQYVMPNIYTLDNCSMVITDPSGEIYEESSGYLASKGFDIKVLNLADPKSGIRYNPLAKATTDLEIDKLAHILMRSANPVVNPSDKIWYDEPQTLIAVLLKCLKNCPNDSWANLHNLQHLLQNFGNDGRNLVDFVIRYAPNQSTLNAFKGFVQSNEKMRSSFLTMAKNSLKLLSNTEVATMMAYDDFDFDDLRSKKTAVYVRLNDDDADFYSFIVNLFYTQLFAAQKKMKYQTSGLPVFVLYDEFGNSFIPSFDSVATTIRRFRVSLSIIIQDFAQLEEKYGRNAAKTILSGGMRSKLFYSGMELDTSLMVEKMLGKVREEKKSRGNTMVREENLLNADRIRRIKKTEAIFIRSNQEPVLLRTSSYFDNPIFKRKAAMRPRAIASRNDPALEYVPL